MSRCAERDAQRLQRRIRHLTVNQGRSRSDHEVAYLRRQVLVLLIDDDAGVPECWRDDLRELERILGRIQRQRQAAA